jgi:hypothetical protein
VGGLGGRMKGLVGGYED